MRIQTEILNQYNAEHKINALAMAVCVKSRYKNSTLYNYEHHKNIYNIPIWTELGMSKKTFKKYTNILLEDGHAHIHNGNLTFEPLFSKPKGVRTEFIDVSKHFLKQLKYRDAVKLIHGTHMAHLANRQKAIVEQKLRANKMVSPDSFDEYRAAKRAAASLKKAGIEINSETQRFSVDRRVRFAIVSLEERLGISKRRVYNAIRFLTQNKMLIVDKNIVWLGNVKKQNYACTPSYGVFVSKSGWTYAVGCNTYCFSMGKASSMALRAKSSKKPF